MRHSRTQCAYHGSFRKTIQWPYWRRVVGRPSRLAHITPEVVQCDFWSVAGWASGYGDIPAEYWQRYIATSSWSPVVDQVLDLMWWNNYLTWCDGTNCSGTQTQSALLEQLHDKLEHIVKEQVLDQLWINNYLISCDGTSKWPAVTGQLLDQQWYHKYTTSCEGTSTGTAVIEPVVDQLC